MCITTHEEVGINIFRESENGWGKDINKSIQNSVYNLHQGFEFAGSQLIMTLAKDFQLKKNR